jgi:hypothetical protein
MTAVNRPLINRTSPVPPLRSWPKSEKIKLGGVIMVGGGLTLELAGMLTSGNAAGVCIVAGGISVGVGFSTLANSMQR